MKLYLLPVLLLLSLPRLLTGQIYPVSDIPDSLKAGAHLVIREYTDIFKVKSINESDETVKKVITVLDREGEKAAFLVLDYDKFSKVKISQVNYYNSSGKKTRSVKQSEIQDFPAIASFMLYSEDRVKVYKPDNAELPYTLEYVYEKNWTNQISFGRWLPVTDYNQSVQEATLIIDHPSVIKINRKVTGTAFSYSSSGSELLSEKWKIKNFLALDDEPLDGGILRRAPSVLPMPSELDYSGFKGHADTWEGYGRWAYDLYRGKNELPSEEANAISIIIKETPDTLDLIKKLYSRLQGKTRYVAVTLGIGGFQPFDVKTVLNTGYGECKALSNYMYSMLGYAGIKAFPALVSAGDGAEPLFRDFPNFSQFNHVIVCIPFRRDSIWLECTDQKRPFGFLGTFTDNRDALLITPDGGKLVRTKVYPALINSREGKHTYTIDSKGSASVNSVVKYTGLLYDKISPLLRSTEDEKRKWLIENTGLPAFRLSGYSLTEDQGILPKATISLKGSTDNYCSFSGKYLLLPVNLDFPMDALPKMVRPRQSDIYVRQAYTSSDTLIFSIPEGFKAESLPGPRVLETQFGSFNSSISANGELILYVRKMELHPGHYKALEYKQLYDFILSVNKYDRLKILLVPK